MKDFRKPVLSRVLLPALFLLGAAGCHYSNPHGSQALEPVTRLLTEPAGAKVKIPRLNMLLEAPCDLPNDIVPADQLIISKDGYRVWEGMLRDIPQVAKGTRRLDLIRQ